MLDLFLHAFSSVHSRGDLKRFAQQGGLYVNDARVDAYTQEVSASAHLVPTGENGVEMCLLRAGKKQYHVVLVVA